jgi:hypothetical protein
LGHPPADHLEAVAMRLVDHFNTFLDDVVNLNTTRVGQLESSIAAVKKVVQTSDWKPEILYFAPQGSWAHKTIIKPIENKAFDADLLVFVQGVAGWTPKNYLSTLRAVFAGHPTYSDKVRRFSHCITIEYAGERKIDIAPCIVNRAGLTRFEVCNFDSDQFERSEPEKYTAWLIERNAWTGGHSLRKVTRLLKYLRDIKTTFTCPSVLLTTIVGERISWADSLDSASFADVPTALKTIAGRLDDWLQANPSKPRVTNPKLSSEILSDLWDDSHYTNFRDKIHTYRTWIDDAYLESDRDESIGKWRRVFGEDFAKSIAIERAAKVSDAAQGLVESAVSKSYAPQADLVTLFSRYGVRALPLGFNTLPHKQRPSWRRAPNSSFSVNVAATLYGTRNGSPLQQLQSGSGPLPKNSWIRFNALTAAGTPFGYEFDVHWRVTNTDREASQANCLRGGFDKSNEASARWERLQYRGVHTVEAFVVRKRDQALVAESEPFYVVIE